MRGLWLGWKMVVISLAIGVGVTVIGVYAFLWSIHDSARWLEITQTVALPFVPVLRKSAIVSDDISPWVLAVGGMLAWSCVVYLLAAAIRRARATWPIG